MKHLRQTSKEQILDRLDKTYFTKHDFVVKFHPETEAIVEIRFVSVPEYVFRILSKDEYVEDNTSSPPKNPLLSPDFLRVPVYKTTTKFLTFERPGVEFVEEHKSEHHYLQDALNRINDWIERILEDLRKTGPLYQMMENEMDSFRSEMEEYLQNLSEEQSNFTREEVSSFEAKLDALKASFDELKEEHKLTDSELKKVKDELETLKKDLHAFPKKTWVRTATNKVLKLIGTYASSNDGQKLATDTARALLRESAKRLLD